MSSGRFTVPVELSEDEYRTLSFMAEMSGETLESCLAGLADGEARFVIHRGEADSETMDFAAEERALQDQVNGHRVDHLIDAGKVLPCHRGQLLAFGQPGTAGQRRVYRRGRGPFHVRMVLGLHGKPPARPELWQL